MKKFFQFIVTFPAANRNIFIIIIAYALFAIGGSLYWAAIPILSADIFGLGTFSISLLIALIGAVYILVDGPTGVILDYIGYKNGAAFGVFFAAVASFIAILEPNLPFFILSIVFLALSWNTLTLSANAYILYSAPKNIEGRAFGMYGSFYSFGVFIATLFVGYVSGWSLAGSGWFFLTMTAISFILIVFFLEPEKRDYNKNFRQALADYWRGSSQWSRGWLAMKEFSPVSWVAALDGFVGYAFGATIWLVIPLALANFANPYLPEGFALGAFEIAGVFAVLIGGFLADRYAKKRLFLGFLFAEIFAVLALGFATDNFLFFISLAFIATVLLDISGPSIDSMLAVIDKNHDKDGTVYGFMGILTDLGFIVGPIVGGLAYDSFGLQGVFIFLAGLMFVNWIAAKILLRNFKEPEAAEARCKGRFCLGGLPRGLGDGGAGLQKL